MTKVIDVLNRTPTIHSDDEVADAYAALTAACRTIGHALHDKIHTGDRWIAACAIAKQLDLLAGDQIYRGAPNLVVHS
jgi:predicted nucleic acid-binding protein